MHGRRQLSGIASCTVAVSGGLANGVETFAYVATASDRAGNTTTQTGSYHVVYAVARDQAFFLQPVSTTDRLTTLATSVAKAGSTVPVKFQLRERDRRDRAGGAAPLWMCRRKARSSPLP